MASVTSCIISRPLSYCTVPWDTSNVSDGVHSVLMRAFDELGRTADTTVAAVVVQNRMTIPIALSTDDIVPPPASKPTGAGELTVNLATGEISGSFTLTGITTVDTVRLNGGYAGTISNNSVLSFVRSQVNPNRWEIPGGTILESVGALAKGALYIDARSSTRTYPEGALRGQVTPKDVRVLFASMTGAQVVPPVSTTLQGIVAVTIEGKNLTLGANPFDAFGRVDATAVQLPTVQAVRMVR